MKYVIGIDIGGTNLRIGTVDEEGNLTNFERKSSESLCIGRRCGEPWAMR